MLNFQVEDIAKTIENVKSYGGSMDGDVIKEEDMKVECFLLIKHILKLFPDSLHESPRW